MRVEGFWLGFEGILVYLIIYDSGLVSLEHLLLSCPMMNWDILVHGAGTQRGYRYNVPEIGGQEMECIVLNSSSFFFIALEPRVE